MRALRIPRCVEGLRLGLGFGWVGWGWVTFGFGLGLGGVDFCYVALLCMRTPCHLEGMFVFMVGSCLLVIPRSVSVCDSRYKDSLRPKVDLLLLTCLRHYSTYGITVPGWKQRRNPLAVCSEIIAAPLSFAPPLRNAARTPSNPSSIYHHVSCSALESCYCCTYCRKLLLVL